MARSIPFGYFNATISSTAVGLPEPAAKSFEVAVVRIEGAPVRFRDDGSDPTTTDGMLLKDGDVLNYDGPFGAIRFIRATAVDATLHVSYYLGAS